MAERGLGRTAQRRVANSTSGRIGSRRFQSPAKPAIADISISDAVARKSDARRLYFHSKKNNGRNVFAWADSTSAGTGARGNSKRFCRSGTVFEKNAVFSLGPRRGKSIASANAKRLSTAELRVILPPKLHRLHSHLFRLHRRRQSKHQ